MLPLLQWLAVLALLLAAAGHDKARASPGDVFVPAHRTRDGSFVPPNVAPLSGGSHLARRPTRGAGRMPPVKPATARHSRVGQPGQRVAPEVNK